MKSLLIAITLLVQSLCLFAQSSVIQVKQDSFKIRNGELIIENRTKNIPGVLTNSGNGKTEFRRMELKNIGDTALAIVGQDTLTYSGSGASGRTVQFRTGVSEGFPADGDSVYINPDFVKKSLKVWRNGLFQYRDPSDGIVIDSALGKITFRPALTDGERVYIEAISGLNLVFELPPTGFSTNLKKLFAGAYNHGSSITFRWATNNNTLYNAPRIVGLGSSTLAGYMLSSPERLGDKIIAWLGNNTSSPIWINLAVGGYTSTKIMPLAEGGIAGQNIDSALNSNPDFIFVSLPSNDVADGKTNAEILTNYRRLDQLAMDRGVPIFWQTTQPRTACTPAQQTQLKVLADSIRKIWPTRFVESFNNLVNTGAATDGVIKTEYVQNDGVHLNNQGIQQIANSLFARWQSYFKPLFGVSGYQVENSTTGTGGWSNPEVITNSALVKRSYTNPTSRTYYRVKANYANGSASPYSNVVTFEPAITTLPPTGNVNRILVDLGGDGVNTISGGNPVGQPTVSPDANGNYWNNWYGNGGSLGFKDNATLSNIVASNNAATSISMKIVGELLGGNGSANTSNAINPNGFNTALQDYPSTAVVDNMFVNNATNPNGVILRVSGLNAAKFYTFKLWGARIDDGGSPRRLEAKVSTDAWANAQSIETRYLTTEPGDYNRAIIFRGLPGTTGTIDINLRTGTGSSYGHLSLVDISISDVNIIPPTVTVADANVTLPTNSVQLIGNITPNGNTITGYQWIQVSGPSTASLSTPTDANCTVGNLTNGTFVFRLTATITGGNQYIDEAVVKVFPNNSGLKTMRVHFSLAAVSPIPGWMNAFGDITNTNVVKTDPVTNWIVDNVGVGVQYWKPLNGVNAVDTAGAATGNNSGIVPDIALDGYWFNDGTLYTTNDNLYIRGLNPAKKYTLKLVASRSSTGPPPRWANWRINGGAEILQNAYLNSTQQSTISGISPDGTGKIRIAVYRNADNATYGFFSYINALIIQEE